MKVSKDLLNFFTLERTLHPFSRYQIFHLRFLLLKKQVLQKISPNNSTYFYPQIIPPLLQIFPISHSFSKYFSTNYINKTYYSNYTRSLNKIFSLNIFFGYTVRRRHNIFRHYKLPLAEQMAQKKIKLPNLSISQGSYTLLRCILLLEPVALNKNQHFGPLLFPTSHITPITFGKFYISFTYS